MSKQILTNIASQIKNPVAVTSAERPISKIVQLYMDNPANKGLMISDKYIPPKQQQPYSACVI